MIFKGSQVFYICHKQSNRSLSSLSRIYWKHFNVVLSFSSYLLGENKLVYSNKLLPFNIKSINPIQNYRYIIELYSSINIIFLSSMSFFDFFCNVFSSEAIKVCYFITINIWYYSMSFYWFILIKIYYICSILYFM